MSIPSVTTKNFVEELSQHPNWNKGSLEKRSVTLIEDPKQSSDFLLRLKQEDGETLLAPFWRSETGKWCFKNGNPHTFERLADMIPEILDHLSKGEALSRRNDTL